MPRLKYLDLYGFKSFAEKTRLVFEEDFVAIVGPNGSGKSNLSDAVRWVLGELSPKSVRGEKMEDVIFAGTAQKKAMNMAQVTLTFDNRDGGIDLPYEEVSVSRKIYRSGESHYLINKNPVRRKDVRSLFFDTGIGKEGYSLIGQGRIEELLSSQSEDRRAIFDEAAGIAGFKFKKQEALSRLEKTERDLESVQLDLKGKSQECRLLKKQADNARRGMELTKALDQHELSLLKVGLDRAKAEQKKLEADQERLEDFLREAKGRLLRAEEALAPYQTSIQSGQAQAGAIEKEDRQLEQEVNALVQELSIRREQIRFFEQDRVRIEKDQAQRAERLTDLEQTLQQATQTEKQVQERVKELEAQQESLRKKEPLSQARRELQTAEEAVDRIKERLSFLDFDRNRAEATDRSLRSAQEKKQEEWKALLAEQDMLREESQVGEKALKELQRTLERDQAEKENQQKRIKELEEAARKLRDQRLALREKQVGLSSRRQVVQSLMDHFEGYQRSVQALLKLGEKDPAIKAHFLGPLADLITVKPGFERAIDVALGGALQNIVVKSQEDARFLIELLKKRELGRITFLPLDQIRSSEPVQLKDPEVIANGVDTLIYEDQLAPVVEHFLGQTVIAEKLDSAIHLSRKRRAGVRIVTLEGEILHAWGAMIGGRINRPNAASLLNRDQQVKELDKAIQASKQEQSQIASLLLKKEQDRKETEEALEELEGRLSQNRVALQKHQVQQGEQKAQMRLLEEKLTQVQAFLDQKGSFSKEDYEKERKRLLAEQTEAVDALNHCREAWAQEQKIQQECEKNQALVADRLAYAKREQVVSENQLADLQERLDQAKKDQEADQSEWTQLGQNLKENQDFIDQGVRSLDEKKKRQEVLHNSRQRLKEERTKLEGAIARELKQKEAALADTNEGEKELYRTQTQLEQVKNRQADLREQYRSSYDLSLEAVEERLRHLVVVESSREKVNEIRKALSQIGFFNYESIDAYEQLAEEVHFLQEQMGDLRKSKEDIHAMIAHLDETMEDQFDRTFQQIKTEYNRIFKILFDGGEASLRLDCDDLLSAGIEIQAKPPGKKLTSLALLSGGERSMTALALMFAIFSIHPAPFCFLDEIDASLDEANITRYVRFLKTLTQQTQFIVITHRKTTMEPADMLYGVTMEKGVTRMVALHLDQLEGEMERGVANGIL